MNHLLMAGARRALLISLIALGFWILVAFLLVHSPGCVERAIEVAPNAESLAQGQLVHHEDASVRDTKLTTSGEGNTVKVNNSNVDRLSYQLLVIGAVATAFLLALSYPVGKLLWIYAASFRQNPRARKKSRSKNF